MVEEEGCMSQSECADIDNGACESQDLRLENRTVDSVILLNIAIEMSHAVYAYSLPKIYPSW